MATTISLTYQFSTTSATPSATASSSFDQAFPESLTLTRLPLLNLLISDVPFFCIGVLAFSLLVFCIATKRWSKPFAYIIASAVVAFIGSVIDLAAIVNLSSPNLFALLVAREMSFAASVGLRFIFFWTYAGRRPQFEPVTLPAPGADAASMPSTRTHSASWSRWGIVGVGVQYATYLGCFMVLVLQTIWRFGALFKLSKFTAEYHADSIVELVIGGILILKFLATAHKSSQNGLLIWRTIGPTVLALWIQKGVAIGNIIVMRFSESALGRLLQAGVMFITMTSLLVSAFLDAPKQSDEAGVPARPNRSSSFQGLTLRNSFRPFLTSTIGVSGNSADQPIDGTGRSSPSRPNAPRRSTTERISQWVSTRMSGGAKIKDDRIRLFAASQSVVDPEKDAGLIGTMTEDMHRSPLDVRQLDAPYAAPKPLLLQRATMQTQSGEENASILAAYTSSRSAKDLESVKQRPPSPAISARSSYSIDRRTRYSTTDAEPMPLPRMPVMDRVDSPVYGLDGIIKKPTVREVAVPPPKRDDAISRKSMAVTVENNSAPTPETNSSSDGSSGLRTLARRQEELEQSVRALRMLSPPAEPQAQPLSRKSSSSRRAADNGDAQTLNRMTMTTGPTSSAASDFSLSNFPSPPAALKSFLVDNESIKSVPITEREWDESLAFKPRETAPLQIRRSSTVRVVDDVPFTLIPPKMPAAVAESRERQNSFPSTTRGSDYSALFGEGPGSATVKGRFAGTEGQRIDVTSFIGGLSRHDLPNLAGASHSRQASDKSDRTGRTARPAVAAIPEESVRDSAAGSTATILPRPLPSGMPPASALTSSLTTSVEDDDAMSVESFSTSIAESPAKSMASKPAALRQKGALPYSPRPSAPGRGANITTAEVGVPKASERPRPPPLRFDGDGKQSPLSTR